jgi:hypothetical protein
MATCAPAITRATWSPVPYIVLGVAFAAGADPAPYGGDADPQGLFFGGVATLSIPWGIVSALLVAIVRRDQRRRGERSGRASSRPPRVVRRLP